MKTLRPTPTRINWTPLFRGLFCILTALSTVLVASGKQSNREHYFALLQSRERIEQELNNLLHNTEAFLNAINNENVSTDALKTIDYLDKTKRHPSEEQVTASELIRNNLAVLEDIGEELKSATRSARALGISIETPREIDSNRERAFITCALSSEKSGQTPLSDDCHATKNLLEFINSVQQAIRSLKKIRSKRDVSEKLSQAHLWIASERKRMAEIQLGIEASEDLEKYAMQTANSIFRPTGTQKQLSQP